MDGCPISCRCRRGGEGVFLLASLRGSHDAAERLAILCWGLGIMAMLVADVFSVSALGMWTSLTAKNAVQKPMTAARRNLRMLPNSGSGVMVRSSSRHPPWRRLWPTG